MISDDDVSYEIITDICITLRERRRALCWTQGDLAHVMGVVQSYICELENGHAKSHSVRTLVRWANALGYQLTVHLDIIV